MKRFFKIIAITLGVLILLLAAVPFFLESKIDSIVQAYADKNINAKVEFADISLSLISSFPKASITVDNLNITNYEPFKDETLATAKSIGFEMPISELWKSESDGPLIINEIEIDEALLTLKTNTAGVTNYDILKSDENSEDQTAAESNGFSFDIKDYTINNSAFAYIDENSTTNLFITELNHEGHGIFSEKTSELDTNTEAKVSLSIDSTAYLSNNNIKLDALIDLDLESSTYTFKDNKGSVNQLPLEFQGYVKLLENAQELDIAFKNPESSFKDFLAVIPEAYSKNLDAVETTGDFKVDGKIKGLISETTIPNLDINIISNNASFKYPDLPKRVENITINTTIKNETGNADDTFVDIDKLNFKIDEDVFKSSATIKQLTTNMLVNANIDGTLNLANISKVYPITLENELQGILKGKVNSNFDMNAIETNAYERIRNKGNLTITNFNYSSEDIVNPIAISKSEIEFKPKHVTLKSFDAKTGTSDLNATGTINNLLGFLLSDKKLKGNFNITSNNFVVGDFMVEDTTVSENNKTTSDAESLKIPEFLDCTINANAKTVIYDNLELKNVKGKLVIADQKADLQNLTSDIFDGKLVINGAVSTQDKTPSFNLVLGANGFNIAKSFKDLELLQSLAPIAKTLQGKLNTSIDLKGRLNNDFSPELSTISGDALAEILTSTISPTQGGILDKLQSNLSFIDFKKLDLKDLKTKLSFENGQVSVKPFNIKYEDIDIKISGSHGFDKSMNYKATFEVPAKYLGTEINNLIAKINDDSAKDIKVPVTANIGGTFIKPSVNTDLANSVSKLTQQLIEIQKQQLIGKGKDKVNDLLDGIINKDNDKASDTTKTSTKDAVKGILGSLLNGNKKEKKKDTVKQKSN